MTTPSEGWDAKELIGKYGNNKEIIPITTNPWFLPALANVAVMLPIVQMTDLNREGDWADPPRS